MKIVKEEGIVVKEIHTKEYSLEYNTAEDEFWCSGCNQEKSGKHMLHSIFFAEYADVAPVCMDCVLEEYNEHI